MDHRNAILLCLVYGDPFDKLFEVEVTESRLVAHLKKLILAEVGDGVLAKELTLWGVNIRIGDMAALEGLRLEENRNDIRKLLPDDTIQEVLPNRADGYVHVLVVLPNKRGTKWKVDDENTEILKKILEGVDCEIIHYRIISSTLNWPGLGISQIGPALKDDKKVSISISRVSQTQFQELLAEHQFRRESVDLNVPPCERQVREFVWNSQMKEDAHGGAYLQWLRDNISLPSNLEFYLASSEPNLLSTSLASSRFNLNGTLNTMIVEKVYVKDLNTVAGIRVGIEKKKVVSKKDTIQAVVELIAAGIYSNYPVVILLTDLRGHWQFFWFQIGCILSCTLDLKRGITLLEGIVGVGRSAAFTGTPIIDSILTRCTFLEAISQGKKGGEMVGGVSNAVELGQKEDLLQLLLPKDDIADMRDVYDVMSQAEIRKWELEKVLGLAVKSPAIQSIARSTGWESMYA